MGYPDDWNSEENRALSIAYSKALAEMSRRDIPESDWDALFATLHLGASTEGAIALINRMLEEADQSPR